MSDVTNNAVEQKAKEYGRVLKREDTVGNVACQNHNIEQHDKKVQCTFRNKSHLIELYLCFFHIHTSIFKYGNMVLRQIIYFVVK